MVCMAARDEHSTASDHTRLATQEGCSRGGWAPAVRVAQLRSLSLVTCFVPQRASGKSRYAPPDRLGAVHGPRAGQGRQLLLSGAGLGTAAVSNSYCTVPGPSSMRARGHSRIGARRMRRLRAPALHSTNSKMATLTRSLMNVAPKVLAERVGAVFT